MPKFIVKHTAILHDGKRYEVGSEIELTAEQAENNALNLQAVVTETKTTAPAADKTAEPTYKGYILFFQSACPFQAFPPEKQQRIQGCRTGTWIEKDSYGTLSLLLSNVASCHRASRMIVSLL